MQKDPAILIMPISLCQQASSKNDKILFCIFPPLIWGNNNRISFKILLFDI